MAKIPTATCVALLLAGAALGQESLPPSPNAADQGMAFCNSQRTGYTPQQLAPPLLAVWKHRARHKPRPAWKEPGWEPQRIDFDYAYAVSGQRDTVYYASSSDHALHALDIATGVEKWVFFTDGPVRLAPECHNDHVLLTSDDGLLYCLKATDGTLVWKYRPNGIPDERLIGNEQMISRWPARSGVLVEGDHVYTTFGMLSPEGVAVCCLDAASGEPIWINDTCGYHFMARPHSTAMGGVSPQGYLATTDRLLVVSCGRSTPALFDKRTGKLTYHEADGDFTGGSRVMTAGEMVFMQADTLQKEYGSQLRRDDASIESEIFQLATLVAIDGRTGREVFSLRGGARGTLADAGLLTLIGRKQLIAVNLEDIRRATPAKASVIKHTLGHFVDAAAICRWKTPVDRAYSLLQASGGMFAGCQDRVHCYDATNGRLLWSGEVDGQVRSMCVVSGRLIVSTSEGQIVCFAPVDLELPHAGPVVGKTTPLGPSLPPPKQGGYCLAVGDHDVHDLTHLAQSFDLVIYATSDNPTSYREQLHETGLYGPRIVVHQIKGATLPYTDYFANEVRCSIPSEDDPADTIAASELYRVLRPCGGVLSIACSPPKMERMRSELANAGASDSEIDFHNGSIQVTRGPLPNSGEWTHQYGDPRKRVASDERRVRLPLKAAWFGGLGPATIVSRHFRTPAPLVKDGRCFTPGLDHLTAIDIYNGRILWQRSLPNVAHWPVAYRGSCFAMDEDQVYALQGRNCLLLNPTNGETESTFKVPPETIASDDKELAWEYLAVTDELVIGSAGRSNTQPSWWSRAYPASRCLFALEKCSGRLRWIYTAREGIDSNAIAIDEGAVCLIDGRPRYDFLTRRGEALPGKPEQARTLLALDLDNGEVLWRQRDLHPALNSLWMDDGVVVATPNPIGKSMTDPGVIKAGGGIAAYSTKDGSFLWRAEHAGAVQPMITGGVFYSPGAYELHTGKPLTWPASNQRVSLRAGTGCSTYAGCPTLAMSRFSSLGFKDLDGQCASFTYPIVRSSCWINMIPAGGLVVVPEGSSSCQCAYNYKTSIALMSDDRHFHYGLGGDDSAGAPGLRVNFGAPGDRADANGAIWRAWPRPVAYGRCLGSQPYGPKPAGPPLPIEEQSTDSACETWGRNPDWIAIADTDLPWLQSCGIEGPLDIVIRRSPQLKEADSLQVVLYFCELDAPPSARVFDVKLQGETVLRNFNIFEAAGGARTALAKSFTIHNAENVRLELKPSSLCGPLPIISGIAITKRDHSNQSSPTWIPSSHTLLPAATAPTSTSAWQLISVNSL